MYYILNIICVGTALLIGDSYGPVLGTYLIKKYNKKILKDKLLIYGTEKDPISYKELQDKKEFFNRKLDVEDCLIIDSGLSKESNIGKVILLKENIKLGKALKRDIKLNSNLNMVGIVGKNKLNNYENFKILRNVKNELLDCLIENSKDKIDEIINQYFEYYYV